MIGMDTIIEILSIIGAITVLYLFYRLMKWLLIKPEYYSTEELQDLVRVSNPIAWGDEGDLPVSHDTMEAVLQKNRLYKEFLARTKRGEKIQKLKEESSREEYLLKTYATLPVQPA